MISYDFSIILPTLNESSSIRKTLVAIRTMLWREHLNAEILVVDDNSADGTANIVNDIIRVYPDIRLYIRHADHGLSNAVMDGFHYAISDVFIVMDADGQHPVDKIPELYRKIQEGYDIAIASRYMPLGGIEDGWGKDRRAISNGATIIARLMFPELTDPVSGFFAIRKSVLTPDINPSGYKILTEILGKGMYLDVVEIPYVFKVREKGHSKLRLKIIMEFCKQMIGILGYTLNHDNSPARPELEMVAAFMIVGISGIFLNTTMLWALTVGYNVSLPVAGVIATEFAICSNYFFNEIWTFRRLVINNNSVVKRFLKFNIISLFGLAISVGIMLLLTNAGMYYLYANLVGIFIAFIWNFLLNRNITWGK